MAGKATFFLNRRSGVRVTSGPSHSQAIDCTKDGAFGPKVGPKSPPLARFWAKVQIGKPNECWPWIGALNGVGYGSFGLNGKIHCASRLAFEFTFGRVLPGLDVMHSCDNPPCCNPAHLSMGTRSQNMMDCSKRGRIFRGGGGWNKGKKQPRKKPTEPSSCTEPRPSGQPDSPRCSDPERSVSYDR